MVDTLAKNKRNTIAVRLTDKDYEQFLRKAGKKNYSIVLRRLIQEYNGNKSEHKNS